MKTNNNLTLEGGAEEYPAFDLQILYEVMRSRRWRIAICGFAGLLLGIGNENRGGRLTLAVSSSVVSRGHDASAFPLAR